MKENMVNPAPAQAKISRKRSLQSICFTTSTNALGTDAKRPIRIVSSLPGRLCDAKSIPKTDSPHHFLMECLDRQGVHAKVMRFDAVHDLFEDPKQKEIDAYGFEALDAVRQRDISKLKQFHTEGRPLKCSNRFGESILHLACRKGFLDVVDFLVNEADVPVWVKDDFGRTPLSDACWTIEPNFELMDVLLSKAPDLLLVSDARGHTPLAYVRREHWEKWTEYLRSKETELKPKKLSFEPEKYEKSLVPTSIDK
jgi:Ankyrin repeats (3 copies)